MTPWISCGDQGTLVCLERTHRWLGNSVLMYSWNCTSSYALLSVLLDLAEAQWQQLHCDQQSVSEEDDQVRELIHTERLIVKRASGRAIVNK